MKYRDHLLEGIRESEDCGELAGCGPEEVGALGCEPTVGLFPWGLFHSCREAERLSTDTSLAHQLGEKRLRALSQEAGPAGEGPATGTRPGREGSSFRARCPRDGDFRMPCAQEEVQKLFLHKADSVLDLTLLVQTILQTLYLAHHKE